MWQISLVIFACFFANIQASMQGVANVYDYHVTQSQFDGDNKETTDISARVTIFCVSGQHRLYIKN